MKHTPLPWFDDASRTYDDARVIRHRGLIVARIPRPITKLEREETEANVRLFLAAPEMFDLLRELYTHQGAAAWTGNDRGRARFVALMEQLGVTPPQPPRGEA